MLCPVLPVFYTVLHPFVLTSGLLCAHNNDTGVFASARAMDVEFVLIVGCLADSHVTAPSETPLVPFCVTCQGEID